MDKIDIKSLDFQELENSIKEMGLPKFRASQIYDWLHKKLVTSFDIVIADAPCSGLGVMSRKSDIKYNITNEAMKDICDLQKAIVANVSRYVKPGGVLLYSTCTIHKAENEKMVKFITENLPFKEDSLKPFVPFLFDKPRKNECHIQLRPDIDGTDGFFVTRFIKSED